MCFEPVTNRLDRVGGVLLLLVFFWAVLPVRGNDVPPASSPDETTNRTESYEKRINKLLDTLQSKDPEKVRRAKSELFQIGRRAIPAIRKKLKASEGGVYYQLLQQMKSLFSAPIKSSTESGSKKEILDWLSVDEELGSIEQWTKNTDLPENEKLLIDRYQDALKRYKSGAPRKALQIAKALLIVSPDLSFKKKVKRFIRTCRQRIFNEQTLQANVTTGKVRYAWEEEISLVYRLKNQSSKTVKIYFDTPKNFSKKKLKRTSEKTNKKGKNEKSGSSRDASQQGRQDVRRVKVSDRTSSTKAIVLEMKQEKIGLHGNRVTETHYREYKVPAQITIPPGKVWTKKVKLDRSEFQHRYVLRRITLGARTIPSIIEIGDKLVNRWILFQKASFELYPRGMRESLPATVEKVKRHLQAENLRDVFFLTFLLEESEYEELAKYFLKILPFLKRKPARTIMFLLQEVTGKQFWYNREQWLDWGRKQYDIEVEPLDKNQNRKPGPNYEK